MAEPSLRRHPVRWAAWLQDHTEHAVGCRRFGTTVELQCGPPWTPWPDALRASTGGSS